MVSPCRPDPRDAGAFQNKTGADRGRARDDPTSVYELLGLEAVRKLGRPVSSGLERLSGHAAEMAALPTEEDTKRREHELLSLEPPASLVERLHLECKRERAVRTG